MPLGGTYKGGPGGARPNEAKRSATSETSEAKSSILADNANYAGSMFDDLFMLTIKDPANEICLPHLIYLVRYSLKFLKAELITSEIEYGKQGKIHVHAVLKTKRSSKLPNGQALSKYLKKYQIFYEESNETELGHYVNRILIDTKSLLVHISPIVSADHKRNVDRYIQKEKDDYESVEFLD